MRVWFVHPTVATPNRFRLAVVCQLLRELVAREAEVAAAASTSAGDTAPPPRRQSHPSGRDTGGLVHAPTTGGRSTKKQFAGPLARVQEELMSCLFRDYDEEVGRGC